MSSVRSWSHRQYLYAGIIVARLSCQYDRVCDIQSNFKIKTGGKNYKVHIHVSAIPVQ